MADLVIRNALVADGVSGALRRADVAVEAGMITAVGDTVSARSRTIDAEIAAMESLLRESRSVTVPAAVGSRS